MYNNYGYANKQAYGLYINNLKFRRLVPNDIRYERIELMIKK